MKTTDKVTVKLETGKESIKRDPYCCAIKAMVGNSMQLKTVAHIPSKFQDRGIFSYRKGMAKLLVPFILLSIALRPSQLEGWKYQYFSILK